ncbi:MAG TPA: hypothetical protein VLA89_19215 [Gemmatimonadales bacterium]|nr:hypothetical protein [Gemmatimonadales bacterium]
MQIDRVAKPDPILDERTKTIRIALERIHARYRAEAKPFLDQLTEIEHLRVYQYFIRD